MTHEQSPPVTLHREINALGGSGTSEWSRGYNEALEEVLTILERRGFTEYADAGDWQPIEIAPDDEPFIAAIEVRTNGGAPWWEQHIIWIDDETGGVHRDCEQGWDLEDYAYWQPLPTPPLSEMASKRSTAEPSAIADEYLIAEVGHG